MKIKTYLDKLNSSPAYKEFIQQHPDSYLVAGFFVLDLESGKGIHQIDYYVPSQKKIAAFTMDNHVTMQLLDTMSKQIPPALEIPTNVDLDAIPGILDDEMKNRGITEDIKKIVAIIQNLGGKKIWNINCVLSGMGILKAHVEDESKTVLKMEKSSIMDYIQKLPMPPQVMQKGQKGPVDSVEVGPEDAEEELKKLDKLEEAIEAEKSKLKKQIGDKKENPKKKSKKSNNKED